MADYADTPDQAELRAAARAFMARATTPAAPTPAPAAPTMIMGQSGQLLAATTHDHEMANGGPPATAGLTGIYGRGMDDKQIMANIGELIETEHKLRQQLANGELSSAEEHEQLRSAEQALDQCWDLLRQRRARRQYGDNPDDASARPVSEVENYRQ